MSATLSARRLFRLMESNSQNCNTQVLRHKVNGKHKEKGDEDEDIHAPSPWPIKVSKKEKKPPRKKSKAKEVNRVHERGFLLEAVESKEDIEGHVVKVVLITEGLGNRHDMNYYGRECLESASLQFEGKPCFLNHPTESDEKDIPERRVEDQCGYYKNVSVGEVNGRRALTGEIHFDLSESGEMGYQKALTALHYAEEFPDLQSEYVGLSINADGDRIDKTMQVGDEVLDVNYVQKFTDVHSCDLVTRPARGGEFVALVESAAGAILKRKEPTMIVKELKAARSVLEETLKDKDLDEKRRKKLQTSSTSLKRLIQEAMKAAEDEDEDEDEKETDDTQDEEESETEKGAPSGKGKNREDGEEEDEDEDAPAPGHKITKTLSVKHDGPAGGEDEDEDEDEDEGESESNREARRIAVKAMLKEAHIPKKVWDLDRLAKLPFSEAKKEIKRLSNMFEALREAEQAHEVPAGNGGKLLEADEPGNYDEMFASCAE